MGAKLRILLIGNGGREHTLAWKLAQSSLVQEIHIVPGNGGTARLDKCSNISNVSSEDFAALVAHAREHDLNFLIPGPEAPLVAGIVDFFAEHIPQMQCFGPRAAAAKMEGSKAFAKDFMKQHAIPSARYETFNDYNKAAAYLRDVDHRVVIKADGLAAGKGVIIPQDQDEAQAALRTIMLDREFGAAGSTVVIEEFLQGEEISILSLSDGKSILSLPPAQDHKRIGDGDTGPNTGGMGTYAPTPVASAALLEEINETILKPTVSGMHEEGMLFCGCLFTGLMLTEVGPRVLEYNVRFGDPESQSCLALLTSDLASLMLACTKKTLGSHTLQIAPLSACTVVAAAGGYPGSYSKGVPMQVPTDPKGAGLHYFHAGTVLEDGHLKTSGGRVIASTATGNTLREAVDKAYKGMEAVKFAGMYYRRDIAHRALPKTSRVSSSVAG